VHFGVTPFPIRDEPENFYTDARVTITSMALTYLNETIPIAAVSYYGIRRPMSYLALILILAWLLVLVTGWVTAKYFPPEHPNSPLGAFDPWPATVLGTIILFGLGVLAHFVRPYVLTVAAHSGNRVEIWHRSVRYVRTIRAALEIARRPRHWNSRALE
jgi:hypothetical protein